MSEEKREERREERPQKLLVLFDLRTQKPKFLGAVWREEHTEHGDFLWGSFGYIVAVVSRENAERFFRLKIRAPPWRGPETAAGLFSTAEAAETEEIPNDLLKALRKLSELTGRTIENMRELLRR